MKINRYEAFCGFAAAGALSMATAATCNGWEWLWYCIAAVWFIAAFRALKWGLE